MAAPAPAMSPSNMPVEQVLDRVTGARRSDADTLLSLHRDVSSATPVVWAQRIIGFDEYTYRTASGHAGRAPVLGFAPGSRHHTVYLAENFSERWPELVANLGTHRSSKVCLYLTRLASVDLEVLRSLLQLSRADTLATFTTPPVDAPHAHTPKIT